MAVAACHSTTGNQAKLGMEMSVVGRLALWLGLGLFVSALGGCIHSLDLAVPVPCGSTVFLFRADVVLRSILLVLLLCPLLTGGGD